MNIVLNILHVVGSLGMGGDSSVILSVMPQLENKGIKFGFITLEGYNPAVVSHLRNSGTEVYTLPGDVRQLGVVEYYKQLKNIFLKLKPTYDTVHVHTSLQSGISLAAAAHAGISSRICHSHTTNILRGVNLLQKIVAVPFFRFLINRYSTQKVACGKSAGEFLFGPKKRFDILYNGINIPAYMEVSEADTIKIKEELGIDESRIVVGHVGRFTDIKNHEYILRLAEMTDEKYAFVLVGDGENYEKIKKSSQKLQNRVFFAGRRSDIPVFMKMFDCLLLPSLGEGFGLVLIEAQAAGCPCITSTNVPVEADLGLGLVEFIDLAEIDRWMKKIEAISRHEDFVKRRQYAARVKDLGFDADCSYEKWVDIYQSGLPGGGENGAVIM